MPGKKKKSARTIRASIKREMAKLRMTRSARIAISNLDTKRVSDPPSVTMHGTVGKIIASLGARRPEKAQIAVHGADRNYRDLRIENTLIDENGDDVKLEKGADVDVTVSSRAHILTVLKKAASKLAKRVKKTVKP
jgi:hypothetical protein